MSFEQLKKNRIHQEGRPRPPDQIRFPQSIARMHARNNALPPEADVWSWPEREDRRLSDSIPEGSCWMSMM
jgi:hypothetical protein